MNSFSNRVVLFFSIAIFNLIAMVNSASCQVNENELGMFFNDPQYRKHSADYFKTAKTYLDYEIKKYAKGSASYQQYTFMRQLLFKKDPIMQAPPFLDVNTCEKGDIGMLSASGRFISYVKIFQILDDERSLMKCSFNRYAADDNWSGPFLWVGKKGTSWTAGSIKDGAVFSLGIITFKKVDDYVYKNLLGGIRKVPAIEVLGSDNWAAMVKKHKTTPTIKVIKRPSPSNSKPGLRTWKDLTGQFSFQATFVRVNGDLVVLQGIDKKEISLPLAKLSAADQQYVKSRLTSDASAKTSLPPSLREGLIAYYKFDGTNAEEISKTTALGPIKKNFSVGRFNTSDTAISLDGVSVVRHLVRNLPTGIQPRSVSLWVRSEPTNGAVKVLLHWGDLAIGKANTIFTKESNYYVGLHGSDLDSKQAVDDKWHHIVQVFDGEVLRVFIDGILGNQLVPQGIIDTAESEVVIGANTGGAYKFRGELDDIRIYNRALPEAEVKALYEYESTPPAEPTAEEILTRDPITNTIGMKLNLIPAGTFTMGSPETEKHRYDSETQHKVTITKAFYMQTAEVTQRQWKAVMGTEPWKGKDFVKEGPNYAASYISWDDAIAYCKKLSKQENKTYRLPTEAEWEYACRAGTQTAWSFGDDEASLGDYAWCEENTSDIDEKHAHQVRLKNPNAFGLYDMHGNVWEWCHDYYEEDYYKQSPAQDPTGPARGSSRVLRGGSWFDISQNTRSAVRPGDVADFRFNFFGFRVVRQLD